MAEMFGERRKQLLRHLLALLSGFTSSKVGADNQCDLPKNKTDKPWLQDVVDRRRRTGCTD
jgi:hypothetical protein